MNNKVKKRVAIYFWDGWLSVSPSVVNMMLILEKNGYDVDCITRYPSNNYAVDIEFPKSIIIHRFGTPTIISINEPKVETDKKYKLSLDAWIKSKLGIANLRTNLKRNIALLKNLYEFIGFGKNIIFGKEYEFVVGIDTYGLIAAGWSFNWRKTKLIYFSLELHFMEEFKYLAEKISKKLERYYHKRSKLTIIQDEFRLNALFEENKVIKTKSNYVIVPNSSIGFHVDLKSSYFRELFNFKSSDVIILHAGGLSTGYMNKEIAEASAVWKEEHKLVFHFASELSINSPSINELAILSQGKAYYSLKPVPLDKLELITASAQIGVVFYNKERGLNHSLIVGASGKLANYLKCGLPVIALDLPGFKELFDIYGCGVVVKNASEIEPAIEIILSNYNLFSENASRCFNERYEFESHFKKVFEKI